MLRELHACMLSPSLEMMAMYDRRREYGPAASGGDCASGPVTGGMLDLPAPKKHITTFSNLRMM